MTSPPPATPPPDKVLELAYEAAQNYLSIQDATLGNTRTRANTLLSTAALLATFSTAVGLLNTDPDKGTVLPALGAWLQFGVTALLGTSVLVVLWPVTGWCFGPSAKEILACLADEDLAGQRKTEGEIRKYVIDEMITGINKNTVNLKKKQRAFRYAAVLLVFEVFVLVLALTILK